MGPNRFSQTSPPLTFTRIERRAGIKYLDLHAVLCSGSPIRLQLAFQMDDFINILITPISCAHLCSIIHTVINTLVSLHTFIGR